MNPLFAGVCLGLLIGVLGCTPPLPPPTETTTEVPAFQGLLDEAHLTGVLLLFDGTHRWTNDTAAALVGDLPASTYKDPALHNRAGNRRNGGRYHRDPLGRDAKGDGHLGNRPVFRRSFSALLCALLPGDCPKDWRRANEGKTTATSALSS